MCNARLLAAVLAGSIPFALPALAQTKYVAPYNLVVIVLDTSISFQIPVPESDVKGRVPVNEAIRVV